MNDQGKFLKIGIGLLTIYGRFCPLHKMKNNAHMDLIKYNKKLIFVVRTKFQC
jgi:hypothetical protein